MRVAFLSHSAKTATFRVGSHYYATELARRGHRVAHLNLPTSWMHVATRRPGVNRDAHAASHGRPHIDGDGVTWLSPRTLAPLRFAAGRYPQQPAARRLAAAVRKALEGMPDVLLVDEPRFLDVVRQFDAPVVYRPTDIQTVPSAVAAEKELAERVRGLVVTSLTVRDQLPRALHRHDPLVLPNGVDVDPFLLTEPPPESTSAVYVGALDDRFSWPTVVAMAEAAPHRTFDIYGPPPRTLPPLPANVKIHGTVPNDQIPSLLWRAAVGLLPLTDAPVNQGRSPMKLYEYLAAGLPVVARTTTTIEAEHAPGVHTYATDAEAQQLMTSDWPPNTEGADLARTRSWSVLAEKLDAYCQDVAGARR